MRAWWQFTVTLVLVLVFTPMMSSMSAVVSTVMRSFSVPMSGEVAWLTPEGRRPYWRGKVTALVYQFMR